MITILNKNEVSVSPEIINAAVAMIQGQEEQPDGHIYNLGEFTEGIQAKTPNHNISNKSQLDKPSI